MGGVSESDLFTLFASLAAEAGRDDLQDELLKRVSSGTPLKPPPPSNSPATFPPLTSGTIEADRLQKEGCHLIHQGNVKDAESFFRKAIKLDPSCADAHGNLGVALAQQKKLPEAEAAFLLAIRFAPTNVTMYINLSTCLNQQKRPQEAETWARQAIQLNPEEPESYRQLGTALNSRKLYEAAETAFLDAAKLDPKHAEGQYRLGQVLARRDKPKEAEDAFREAVKLKPTFSSAWSALGHFLAERDKTAEALDCAREAVKHDPKNADLHNTLGVALAACEKFSEAETEYREAIRLSPKLVSAYSNLGNSLRAMGRVEEGEKSLRESLKLKPNYTEAHNNLGIVLVPLGRQEEGIKHYEEAIRLRPEYPEAHLNRALNWLCNGDFARGWPEYEWRLKVKPFKHKVIPGPRWDGSPLEGKTLLIAAEQGLGDSIHFIRYATLAKERGAKVIFDCPTPLASLLATCPGIDQVSPKGQKSVYDTYVSLLSLPGIFGVPPEATPAPVPYLRGDPERIEHWRKELAGTSGLRVGIAWQGSKIHKGDHLRSVPLTRFAPLAAVPGVSLMSIQKGPGSEQLTEGSAKDMGVLDFGAKTAPEMADVAALMMNLDLVIAVDTSLVHLAGALGRPTWVAIPFAPDWRWLRDREDTPWYPSMRLFRQAARGDWDGVFGRLAAALSAASRAKAEGRWDSHPLDKTEATE
jgi:tetratricopeptide (TPR) repeat protein